MKVAAKVLALLAVLGCSDDGVDLSQLDGVSYTLEVDRIANNPDVQFPSERLEESDYEATDQGNQYDVSFSENAESVTIAGKLIAEETVVVMGNIETDAESFRQYGIEEGLFAGGRFSVWITANHFEAEFTVYGSGIPIIKSERGRLVADEGRVLYSERACTESLPPFGQGGSDSTVVEHR